MNDKKQYLELKKKLDEIRSDVTLQKWKVLSKAYKLGKKIWGHSFSERKLSDDMDIPYTTCKRCLSLNRANKRTWKLIKEKKISAFKVAMICSEKSKYFQDEIINIVIRDNLSTCDISNLKINDVEDVNVERHRIAVEKGYSRMDSAYSQMKNWITRGLVFIKLSPDRIPQNKHKDVIENLIKLNHEISLFIKKMEVEKK